jgi:hypothetical protein
MEKSSEELLRRSRNREVRNRAMGLNRTDLIVKKPQEVWLFPLLTIDIPPRRVTTIARVARSKCPGEGSLSTKARLYHEGGWRAEEAFRMLLDAEGISYHHKRYESELYDFTLQDTTIGVRNAHHRRVMEFEHGTPMVAYPLRRLVDPNNHIAEYVLGTTGISIPSGRAWVALWGLITRDRLVELMREELGSKPIPTDNSCAHISIEEYDPALLSKVLDLKPNPFE